MGADDTRCDRHGNALRESLLKGELSFWGERPMIARLRGVANPDHYEPSYVISVPYGPILAIARRKSGSTGVVFRAAQWGKNPAKTTKAGLVGPA